MMFMAKVCLDAGHYGKYNQSPVLKSYYESDMTWKLHNYLASELEAWGVTVIKTRTNQATDRELVSRGYASKGCDLFLSLHSNAASTDKARYAVAIVMRDNKTQSYDDLSRDIGKKLADAVADIMGVDSSVYSKAYVGDRDGNGLQDDEWYGVLQGAKQAKTPGVILEHSFHTNLESAKWLSKDANLKKLAVKEAEVISKWLGIKEKPKAKTEPEKKETTPKKQTKKSLLELAKEVIQGKWFTGAARKSAITKAYKAGEISYTYEQIQKKVNELLSGKSATKVHTVVKGDTLSAIAKKYSTTVARIAKDNNLGNPNVIRVGQKLIIN